MPEEMSAVVAKLLKSQQEFMTQILEQQKTFMQLSTSSDTSSNIPPFQTFDKEKCTWEIYLQQLEQHFEAYNVESHEKRKSYLLSWLGSETYELLQNLFGSCKLASNTYSDITQKLSEHFQAKIHICTARHEFFKCRMRPNQSYSEWIADLRGLARQCQFVCTEDNCTKEFVDDMIRDVIVLYTPHDSVRSATLQKAKASLSDVILIAEAYEATQKSLKALKNETDCAEVNKVVSKQFVKKPNNKKISQHRKQSCSGCFIQHPRDECKFLKATCRKCGKKGHIAPVCQSNFKKKAQREQNIYAIEHILSVKHFRTEKNKLLLDVKINDTNMEFLLDTGASTTVIGIPGFKKLNCPKYGPPSCKLKAFGKNSIPILGETVVTVEFNGESHKLPLLIANTPDADNIFGLNWAHIFGIQIKFTAKRSSQNSEQINSVSLIKHLPTPTSDVNNLLSTFPQLFSNTLGCCLNFEAHLYLKPHATPKFFKARPIPYAQLEAFKTEAKRLTEAGIWKPIRFSQWAAPIVIVTKQNKRLRICGDFKVTLNPYLEVDQHPIPRPEELFQKLASGELFSKIDMSDAYLQIKLDNESKQLAVVNTPIGLFQYERLPFGIASSPAIFQRTLEMILSGLDCAIYIDDIVVTGKTHKEHLRNLEAVLQRLQDNGLRVNRSKCRFFQQEVEYLGHVIDRRGVRPSDSGLVALERLPRPRNLKELESFMGKVNYYNKFVNNFSQLAAPLNALRKKNTQFSWKTEQESAFQRIKQKIINATRLSHYHPEWPLILAADASAFGIGAAISHLTPEGNERPIAFASKTLNEAQRRYSQIEKEALAIIYGVTKFHQYLCGRKFILLTDHKPLVTIFHPNKGLPTTTLNRLQRWAIILMSYCYEIRYRPTDKHANVDALSRLPVGHDTSFDQCEVSCFEISTLQEDQLDIFPIKTHIIAQYTISDPDLKKVSAYIHNGWPAKLPSNECHLQPYFIRKASLTQCKGVILLEMEKTRVVLPNSLRKRTLQMLHQGHWGMVRMKQLARTHCWWPNIDTEIEAAVKSCTICQHHSPSPPKEFSAWPKPNSPWQRIHVDFAGPFLGKMWLICIDALSKFPFVVQMHQTTTSATILALEKIFSLEGLPESIVSDNGPQFTSSQFNEFCHKNGIISIKTAPFHPASNGEAERFVRTFKSNFKKIVEEEENLDKALLKCLETYRTTPNPETSQSPAEVLHGRKHRTLLSQMLPNTHSYAKLQYSGTGKFSINQTVYTRNYSKGHRWVGGTIVTHLGRRMYLVRTKLGLWKRHQNQIRTRSESADTCQAPTEVLLEADELQKPDVHNEEQQSTIDQDTDQPARESNEDQLPLNDKIPTPRRSQRPRKPVVRFGHEAPRHN